MRRGRNEAKVLTEVASLRALQQRAAERAATLADQTRRDAEERHEEGRAAVRAAERGWTDAMAEARLDPARAGAWLRVLDSRRREESRLAGLAEAATAEANAQRRALQLAQARAEAARVRARDAVRAAALRRDEARLAELEDRRAAAGRPA